MEQLLHLVTTGHVFAVSTFSPVIAAFNADSIASGIRSFLLPLVLLAVGAIAVKFLVQRQMTQFFQFAAIAVLVLVLLTQPTILTSVAQWVASLFK